MSFLYAGAVFIGSKQKLACRPITFANDDIMISQWEMSLVIRPLRSSWFTFLVMMRNIRQEKSKLDQHTAETVSPHGQGLRAPHRRSLPKLSVLKKIFCH